MKRFCLLFVLLPSVSWSQSDFSVEWLLDGLGFSGQNFTTLVLDMNVETNTFSASGFLQQGTFTVPVSGSCILTNTGGIYCNIQADQNTLNFDVSPTLNGFITLKDANGFAASFSEATFVGID